MPTRKNVTPDNRSTSSREEEMTLKDDDEIELLESLLPAEGKKPSDEESIQTDKHWLAQTIDKNPEFFKQGMKALFCFCGLQASYLTWGYMQELIMTTQFEPTSGSEKGYFPSAAFCVFSNRFLALIVAIIAVRIKHGAILANNKAPLLAFSPSALSNTISSWAQYASLKFVTFPVQTVFKSSKIIAVMLMGKLMKGATYPWAQYVEAFFITCGVAIFSLASKITNDDDNTEDANGEDEQEENKTEFYGLILLLIYISFDSFTSQYQDKVYTKYGRSNVDPYQMMLGVNSSAIVITTAGLLFSGDFPIVWEFLLVNPEAFKYNIITAITSASGQLFIFYTIKEFGPIVFTLMMIIRQMISVCISSVRFNHPISPLGMLGFFLVFSVLFYQTRRKYYARLNANNVNTSRGTTDKK